MTSQDATAPAAPLVDLVQVGLAGQIGVRGVSRADGGGVGGGVIEVFGDGVFASVVGVQDHEVVQKEPVDILHGQRNEKKNNKTTKIEN